MKLCGHLNVLQVKLSCRQQQLFTEMLIASPRSPMDTLQKRTPGEAIIHTSKPHPQTGAPQENYSYLSASIPRRRDFGDVLFIL